MSKVVISYDGCGQTCNRFWSWIPLFLLKKRENVRVYILLPDYHLKYFPKLIQYFAFPCCSINQFFFRFLGYNKVKGIYWRMFNNRVAISIYKYINKFFSIKIFINAWDMVMNMESLKLDTSEKEIVRELFSPSDKVKKDVDEQFTNIRSDFDIIVGVHIRRGDYLQYHKGMFYYTNDKYWEVMTQMKKIYAPKKICFIICSNEVIDLNAFKEIDCQCIKIASAVHDLYALSKVDYIIGPPSTFSKWASFIGDVPLAELLPGEFFITKEHFFVCDSFKFRMESLLLIKKGEIIC